MTRRGRLLVLALSLSLVGNAGLGGLLYLKSQDAALAADDAAARATERDLLMTLLPALRPRISRSELAAELRSRYPGEQINIGNTEVQWRLFHFWFDRSGRLENVQWGS